MLTQIIVDTIRGIEDILQDRKLVREFGISREYLNARKITGILYRDGYISDEQFLEEFDAVSKQYPEDWEKFQAYMKTLESE